MKKIYNSLFALILFSNLVYAQIKWDLDYESANFAFLVVDYITYEFEGGYFTKFDYKKGYDNWNIPFSIVYNQPSDYGNILFSYSATDDTIFAADIWWLGTGHITFPDTIIEASVFSYDPTLQIYPISVSYYNYLGEIADSIFKRKADSSWLAVKKLTVLNKFNEDGNVFRIGLYLYAPAVGMFNPDLAKWVIFLYRGQVIVDVDDELQTIKTFHLFQNYPNPVNPTTTIEFYIPKESIVKLNVYNLLGQLITTLINKKLSEGNHKVIFDGSDYPTGVYFYEMTSGNHRITKKFIYLK